MLKVRLITQKSKSTTDKYITDYVTKVTWEGSDTQVCRTAEMNVINNPFDKNLQVNINLGDLIYLYCDENKKKMRCIFVGVVTGRSRTDLIGTASYTVKDFMFYLLRSSGTYVVNNRKAEDIAKMVCDDMQIQTGTLYKTKVNIGRNIYDAETCYNIILRAYNKAAKQMSEKDSPIFMPTMNGRKFCVIPKGQSSGITLKMNTDITSSAYEENLEDMINQVWVYEDSGKRIAVISNAKHVKKYGILQQAYKVEEGVDYKSAAKGMLTGISKTASVEAVGNIACMAGYAVYIKDSITQLRGKFFIENDSHTWENGIHTMRLNLRFKNVLEEVKDGE